MKRFILILVIIFCAISMLLFYSMNIEPRMLITKHETLYIPNWNTKLNCFKVGVISDLHIGYGYSSISKLNYIVNKMNSEAPDLIVLLGDLDANGIESSKYSPEQISNSLRQLHGKYGVISIMGNHDYVPPNIVKRIFKDANITVLENQTTYIYPNNQQLRIVGFKDLWHYSIVPAEIIQNKNVPTLVLSHNPDIFPQIPQNISLTLSGHTHGGEVYIPLLGSPTVPSKYNQRYRKGYVVENNKPLYVSGGVGTLSHFRFCNLPEISILRLYSQDKNHIIANTKPKCGFKENYIPYYRKLIKKEF